MKHRVLPGATCFNDLLHVMKVDVPVPTELRVALLQKTLDLETLQLILNYSSMLTSSDNSHYFYLLIMQPVWSLLLSAKIQNNQSGTKS